jgi:hypothetical protein
MTTPGLELPKGMTTPGQQLPKGMTTPGLQLPKGMTTPGLQLPKGMTTPGQQLRGAWGSLVVKALRYKSEGAGIDSRCRRGFFRGIRQFHVPWGRLSL